MFTTASFLVLVAAEYWQVADAPEALPLIEREVMDLVVRLMTGDQ